MKLETKFKADKHIRPSRLLWVDLEMTGLDTDIHRIVEVAAIVTDFDFHELAVYEAVVHQSEAILDKSSEFSKTMHESNGLYPKVRTSQISEEMAQQQLRQIIDEHIPQTGVFLAGNSVRSDWTFLFEQWPLIGELLHYRMLDVSAFKLWWIGTGHSEYRKTETHRALDDIRESIAELKYYLAEMKK